MDVEEQVERRQVVGSLDERGSQRRTDLAPIEEIDLLERMLRIDQLRRRNGDAGFSHLTDEAEHRRQQHKPDRLRCDR